MSTQVFNQILEWKQDKLMTRTCNRPIPRKKITTFNASLCGIMLFAFANILIYKVNAPLSYTGCSISAKTHWQWRIWFSSGTSWGTTRWNVWARSIRSWEQLSGHFQWFWGLRQLANMTSRQWRYSHSCSGGSSTTFTGSTGCTKKII